MWFLTRYPSRVEINALVISLPKSYQLTTQQFRITPDDNNNDSVNDSNGNDRGNNGNTVSSQYRICIPFPWSPEKDPTNGGMTFTDETVSLKTLLSSTMSTESVNTVDTTTIKVYRKVLGLKNDQPDINPLLINDLSEKYSWDDWGFMTFVIEPNQWYTLTYKHKISVYSTLNVPTILPVNLIYKKIPINVTVFAVNGERRGKQPFLDTVPVTQEQVSTIKNAGFDIIDCYRTNDMFNGDSDVCISTCNWESSDDELGAGYTSDESD